MSVNATDPMIGRLIDGRYQVRSRIARGGMATVYLATDLRLERRVAIKVMHGHLADDSQFKQRFIQEARSAARLAHPNVVNVYDQGQDSDSAYLVMEYLPGITLRQLLEEYGSLTPQQTIDISEAVLAGLAAAHKAGIVHRDLKPENVLLADDGRIKIADFGLARAASANTATGAALLGTIAYLSPELVTRGIADTRSDIYAVGIMMYEMLTGEQPFTGEQPMQIAYRHANEPIPPPSRKNDKVPPELDEIVLWATAKDPEHRPDDARALLEQVRDTESVLHPDDAATSARTAVLPAAPARKPPTAPIRPLADAETQILGTRRAAVPGPPPAPASPAPPRPRRRRRWIPLLIILLLALTAGGAAWWFTLGPGARVTVPSSLEGLTVEQARAKLTDLGFVVAEETGTTSSPTVLVDLVAQTEPAFGESLPRGATVKLLLSTGPEPIPIAFDVGMTQVAAEEIVAASFRLDGVEERFDPTVPAGQLLDALGADGASLLEVATYGELQPIKLIVSVGWLPDVTGKTFAEAAEIYDGADITAVSGPEEFHPEIPAGAVIAPVLTDPGGAVLIIRPGGEVHLRISKGPEQVAVPDVLGMTWRAAEQTLTGAGFVIEFKNAISEYLSGVPDSARVKSVEPGAGTVLDKGSTLVVALEAG